ncbi:hypothetical protein Tco_0456006 [Tanacetum coccineum]
MPSRGVYFSVIDFSKDEPFSGSTTNHSNTLPPSSSPVKTSEILEEFADELTLLKKVVHEENFQVYSNPLFEFDDNFTSSNENPLFNEMDEDVINKNSNVSDEPVLLNTPLTDKVESFAPEDDIDEIDAFLAMKVSSNFEEGYFDSEGDFLSEPVQEEIDIFLVPDDLIPLGVENDNSKDEDIELPNNDHQDNPSSPRPPPEPPDVFLNFKPATAMNDGDFNQREIVLSLNVKDVNSFTFFIWTFLPIFTYHEDSPVILSLINENLVFNPGISTFHFSFKPVPFSLPKDE